MRIDVYADFTCPWCFIGLKRIRQALAARPRTKPEMHWRPYQLNPNLPRGGLDRRTYLSLKFGGRERTRQLHEVIEHAGAAVGIGFRFDRIERQPSTVDAHRLVRLAAEANLLPAAGLEALVMAIYRAFFIDGMDIGEPEALLALASGAGLASTTIGAYLAAETNAEAIRAEDLRARRMGIDGVPCFVIDERYAIAGAQEPEAFLPLFDLAAA